MDTQAFYTIPTEIWVSLRHCIHHDHGYVLTVVVGEDHCICTSEIPKLHDVDRVPTDHWSSQLQLGRSDLAALALVSRRTYPLTNPLLYKVAEISLCKCSDRYLNALEYTMSTSKTLAGIVRTFFVDMSITCHLKPCSTSLEDLQSVKWHDKLKWKFPRPVVGIIPGPSGSREVANGVRKDVHVNWHHDCMQVLQQNSVKQILRSLWSLENITVGNHPLVPFC